jgi:hypothetical protein
MARCAGPLPGQCIDDFKIQDHINFDCVDRSDEQISKQVLTGSELDWDNAAQCDNYLGEKGVEGFGCQTMWNDTCIPIHIWCSPQALCPCDNRLSTRSPAICGNTTFWQDIPCLTMDRGDNGTRCRGSNPGQCSFAKFGFDWCYDKSEQIFNLTQPCPPLNYSTDYHQDGYNSSYDQYHCWDSCSEPGPNCTPVATLAISTAASQGCASILSSGATSLQTVTRGRMRMGV